MVSKRRVRPDEKNASVANYNVISHHINCNRIDHGFSFSSFNPNELSNETKTIEVKFYLQMKRVAVTSELKDFTRNLKDPEFVVGLSFAFQLDSKKAKEEFDKLIEIEIKPIINRTLADMTAEDLRGSRRARMHSNQTVKFN